jgi:hypothetical protein
MATASMASITSMVNPLTKVMGNKLPANLYQSTDWTNYRIVNASSIEYKDEWAPPCECRLPKVKVTNGKIDFNFADSRENRKAAYNPYKYNIKGNWRPKVSYAYLTGRHASEKVSPRKDGFFNNFNPFYKQDQPNGKWLINTTGWTFASQVTQYNPYGQEIENQDALLHFSSALYGYNFRFPVAVASNTPYSGLAFDGFEDYGFNTCDTTSHFSFNRSMENNKVAISSSQSHSGKKSLKVSPGNKAIVKKRVITCNPTN